MTAPEAVGILNQFAYRQRRDWQAHERLGRLGSSPTILSPTLGELGYSFALGVAEGIQHAVIAIPAHESQKKS